MLKNMKKSTKSNLVTLSIVVGFYIFIQILGGVGLLTNSFSGQLVPICAYVILAVSLNLTVGILGELSLGHAGFMSVGAFSGTLVYVVLHETAPQPLAMLLAFVVGGVVAGLFGFLVGIPVLRLSGDYLAIVTLGFGLIVENVIANLPFAGGDGLANGTASSSLYANGLGLSTSLQAKYVWLVLGITILCIALMCMFIRSKYGRAIEAIRDDEIAASASGVNTTYYKILTFVISAFFAGLAGGLYATCFSSLTTASFTFTSASIWNSTFIVVIVVLGGMGSMAGSVVAAIVLTAAPEALRAFDDYRMIVYSLLLIATMIFKPSGLLGRYDFSMKRIIEKCVNGELFASFMRGRGKGAEEA